MKLTLWPVTVGASSCVVETYTKPAGIISMTPPNEPRPLASIVTTICSPPWTELDENARVPVAAVGAVPTVTVDSPPTATLSRWLLVTVPVIVYEPGVSETVTV